MTRWNIIRQDEKIYIVPKVKTTFTNDFNKHKYINDKNKCSINVLHKKRNWKEICQLCLDNIELPEGTTNLNSITYSDLVFNFKTGTGKIISIPLGEEEAETKILEDVLRNNFDPAFMRTNYPHTFFANHFNDFFTTVLYSLFRESSTLNSMIQDVLIEDTISFDDHYYTFKLGSVEHNKLILVVSCDDEEFNACNITMTNEDTLIFPEDNELLVRVSYSDYMVSDGTVTVADEQLQTINSYQFQENRIIINFEDNTFKLSREGKIINIELQDPNDENNHLLISHILYYNILPRNVIFSNNFLVELESVVGDNGENIELIAHVTSRDGSSVDGRVDFYID